MGYGLRTLVPIRSGQLVTEYRGEVISTETCKQRTETIYQGMTCSYFLDYANGEVLDGTMRGSDARFVVW